MTRAQATTLVWFIKFTIRFMAGSDVGIRPGEYIKEEAKFIDAMTDEVI